MQGQVPDDEGSQVEASDESTLSQGSAIIRTSRLRVGVPRARQAIRHAVQGSSWDGCSDQSACDVAR